MPLPAVSARLEPGGELTGGDLFESPQPCEPRPLRSTLEEHFLARVRALPEDAQTLVLLAAADTSAEAVVLWRAAERFGVGREAASQPGVDELLGFKPRVAFRVPLIRSAVYKGASPEARRLAHAALAAATDPKLDPDRRAWHLAEAAHGEDEQVAAELERSSERARSRGGWASVAAFLERAAELTPEAGRRAERELSAANAKLVAGDGDSAQALLEQARPRLTDPLARAMAHRLEGSIHMARGPVTDAPMLLLEAARALEPLDARLARETLLVALNAAMLASRRAATEVARAALAVPPIPGTEATARDLLFDGFVVSLTAEHSVATPLLGRAVAALRSYEPGDDDWLDWFWLGRFAATALMDDEATYAIVSRWVQLARERGALTTLPFALAVLANYCQVPEGRLAAAEASLAEAREISAAMGSPGIMGTLGDTAAVVLMAWRGRAEQVRSTAAWVALELKRNSDALPMAVTEYAITVLELGLGNHHAALAPALGIYEEDSPWVGTQVLPDLVEAAVRSGKRKEALSALERLSERARASRTDFGLGLLALSQALLAANDDAELLYQQAIGHLRRCRTGTALARAHLLYGEWLRQRQLDAREQLRTAFEMFDAMGAAAFARRARAELRATGEEVCQRPSETRDELTAQEAKIARLASEGASNQEIAAQLVISSSTVAYHLNSALRKLHVDTRAQIAHALAQRTEVGDPRTAARRR